MNQGNMSHWLPCLLEFKGLLISYSAGFAFGSPLVSRRGVARRWEVWAGHLCTALLPSHPHPAPLLDNAPGMTVTGVHVVPCPGVCRGC